MAAQKGAPTREQMAAIRADLASKGESAQFMWLKSFTEILDTMTASMARSTTARAMLALAIIEYGTKGTEPKFPDIPYTDEATGEERVLPAFALQMAFEGVRVNIDISVRNCWNGSKGGRPRKTETKARKKQAEAAQHEFPEISDEQLDAMASAAFYEEEIGL